ncbi:DUF5672 family protein [Dyadobacter sp.]|uniref:DUF5672 family protein n=1 Tax=Dyadobacter sp. TaxID=1914288 RepID=UPI003F71D5D0
MNRPGNVVVVVPIYKTTLTNYEEISLQQCARVLGNYPIIAVKPENLNLDPLPGNAVFKEAISFDPSYFSGIQGYNRLMMSQEFYAKFLEYEFILIHQLDAFVFQDELTKWCQSGYDYIGAPWPKHLEEPDIIKALKTKAITFYHQWRNIQEDGLPHPRQFDNQVGNGGFSLRRVHKFHRIAGEMREKIEAYHQRTEHQFHEDVFWSIETNRGIPQLRIPEYKKAYQFSIENNPERGVRFNKGKLPFGCHSWDHHLEFWKPYIEAFGYKLD